LGGQIAYTDAWWLILAQSDAVHMPSFDVVIALSIVNGEKRRSSMGMAPHRHRTDDRIDYDLMEKM
jgi:hypothetical protein